MSDIKKRAPSTGANSLVNLILISCFSLTGTVQSYTVPNKLISPVSGLMSKMPLKGLENPQVYST